jgi:hypothetical protein
MSFGINGSVLDTLGNVVNLDPIVYVVSNLAAGDPRKAAGASDFVLQNNIKNAIVNPGPAAGATTFGAFNNGLTTIIQETRLADGSIDFSVFATSLGPVYTFLPNQAARAVVTATVFGDPMASAFFDPFVIPPNAILPDYGVDGSNVPEPATGLLMLIALACATFSRRRSHRHI